MRVFARFLAFEAIGWLFAGAILAWLAEAELVPIWLAVVLFGGLVVKDLALFPLTRLAYEHGPTHGGAELLGTDVRVESELAPEGYVRAGSERWRARLSDGGVGPLCEGQMVRVRELQGLTLIVEPLESAEG